MTNDETTEKIFRFHFFFFFRLRSWKLVELTLMLTQVWIFDASGSLSAAAVAKIATHSVSGPKHNRQPARGIICRRRRIRSSSVMAMLKSYWLALLCEVEHRLLILPVGRHI